MKALGVKNRCRLFEVPKNIDFIIAEPRMQRYIDYSAEIYGVYLEYISKDDIHVYSVDEAFLDVTAYLRLYNKTPREMAVMLMDAVRERVGVRATCGIGTNLNLTKIALDITAKHSPDFIGELDEESYRATLWNHRPLTDFWRIGPGTVRRLENYGIHTMGEICKTDESLLYKIFGVDAELLIDHAWGREPVTIADIKNYKASTESFSSGQVLASGYEPEKALLVVKEMTDLICLELVEREAVAESITLELVYEAYYNAEPARGTARFSKPASGDGIIIPAVTGIFERICDRTKKVRRIYITVNNLSRDDNNDVLSLFAEEDERQEKNKNVQQAVVSLKKRFGKNVVLKGMNYKEGATTIERNGQIGGHKAGK